VNPIVSEILVQIVLPAVGTALAVVIPLLINKAAALAREKWNVQVTETQQAQLEELLLKAVQYAEQRGVAAMKTTGTPTPGQKKALDALNFLVVEAQALKLPEVAEARMQMLLEAKFAELTASDALPKAKTEKPS